MPSPTIRETLAMATETLRMNGLETPRLDAEVIMAAVLNLSRPDLYIKSEDAVSPERLTKYFSLVERRAAREPVAYITGVKEFMSLPFRVNRDVLVPRPETELLVEEALAIKPLRIIDVGTGSGAIAVSMAYYLPGSRVTAIDISAEALAVARHNAVLHGVAGRVTFLKGNLVDPLVKSEHYGCFDLVAANLPYIPSSEMDNLPVDVRGYEPAKALDGGPGGLEKYRELCPRAFELLKTGGAILLEIGYGQAVQLLAFLTGVGYQNIQVIRDLAGLERLVKAYKP